MEIGNRIRKIRSQQGRTIQEIADECHCSKALLSKIENGKVVPAVATLSKIAKSLGVKISVLMEDGEDGKTAFTPNVSDNDSLFVPTSKGYRIFAFAPQYINKKMQPVLKRVISLFEILTALPESQPFHRQSRLPKAPLDLLPQAIIGEQNNLNTACQQGREHIGLQEVNDR